MKVNFEIEPQEMTEVLKLIGQAVAMDREDSIVRRQTDEVEHQTQKLADKISRLDDNQDKIMDVLQGLRSKIDLSISSSKKA